MAEVRSSSVEFQTVSQHLSEPVIKRYRDRQLSPAEILSLDDHLMQCETCAIRILGETPQSAQTQVVAALQVAMADDDPHLAHQPMVDYVDDLLDDVDRELIESHLGLCQACQIEVRDLRTMKAQLAELPNTIYRPRERSSFRPRLAAWWQMPFVRIPAQAAAALIIIGLIVLAGIHFSRRSAQIAQQKGTPEKQPSSVSPTASPSATQPITPQQREARTDQQIVDLIDGDRHITLSSADKLAGLESAPTQIQSQVAVALKNGQVKTPSFIADLKGKAGELMGVREAQYGLAYPVATAVAVQTPTFAWRPIADAENYVVTVYDTAGRKVVSSAPVTETTWQSKVHLSRGRSYSWQVRANVNGKELLMPPPAAAEARFRIIDDTRARELAEARRDFSKSHLLLGVLYAETGLLRESARELRKVVQANPKSTVARSLLRSIEDQSKMK